MKVPMNRALLAALTLGLASGPASAVVNLSPASGTSFTPYTYAKETLGTLPKKTVDGTDYYTVTARNEDDINFTFTSGISSAGNDSVLLYITLDGMAFTAAPSSIAGTAGTGGAVSTFTAASTVTAGANTALYRLTTGRLATDSTITIDLAATGTKESIYVTAAHMGGITVRLINSDLNDVQDGLGTKEHMQAGAVVGKAALKETVTGLTQTAKVDADFKGFDTEGTHKAASIGKVTVTVATPNLNLADGSDGVDAVSDLVSTAASTTSVRSSKVVVKGDFSFATVVTSVPVGNTGGLQNDNAATTAATCPSGSAVPLAVADDKMSASVDVGDTNGDNQFGSGRHICVQAEDDTVITKGSYTVDLDYNVTATNRVSPAQDSLGNAFGMIRHDGTTINIPFVTTYDGYNQRFMIVNNGAATKYAFTFMPEDGITAADGTKASGDLPMGTTHLKAMDIVSLTGGTRTAATVTIPSQKTNIEMSSVLVTKETGATDLTVLMAE